MAIPFDIRESDEFEISWKKLSYEVRSRAREFDESILAAVGTLYQKGPGYGQPHGDALYAVPLMEGYLLVYEWTTDRDDHGNAIFNHLALLPIERI
jgi:hypothetical protein